MSRNPISRVGPVQLREHIVRLSKRSGIPFELCGGFGSPHEIHLYGRCVVTGRTPTRIFDTMQDVMRLLGALRLEPCQTGAEVIQWVGETSSNVPYLREIKIAVLRGLVIGMGLKWPEGEWEMPEDPFPVYGISIPPNRVAEFYYKVSQMSPDLVFQDLGTADCPSRELAEALHGDHGIMTAEYTE